MKTLIEHQHRQLVVEFEDKSIGISDSKLMGVLAMLNCDPDTDQTVSVKGRQFWVFHDNELVRKYMAAYYSVWNGNVAHLSFVRACFGKAKQFANFAKEKHERKLSFATTQQPASVDRLR